MAADAEIFRIFQVISVLPYFIKYRLKIKKIMRLSDLKIILVSIIVMFCLNTAGTAQPQVNAVSGATNMQLQFDSQAATPALNTIVRTTESEADIFGLNAAREPDGFASVAMKLSEYRKISPGKLEEILLFDHPSGKTRVLMSMKWKAENLY